MTAIQSNAGRIERDRQRIEPAAIRRAATVGRQAMMHAVHAVRLGHDPAQAAVDVLTGNASIGQAGLVPLFQMMLVNADLMGRRRTLLNARQHFGKRINLSKEEDDQKKLLALLLLLGLLSEDEQRAIFAFYLPVARKMVQGLATPLAADLHELRAARVAGKSIFDLVTKQDFPAAFNPASPPAPSLLSHKALSQHPFSTPSIKADPNGVRAYEAAARYIFRRNGLVPQFQSRVETWVNSSVTTAYENGRGEGWKTPEIADALWGFRYSAILDNKTTECCRKLDDTRAPVGDPFWLRFTPPNHFGCRSCRVEVWKSSALANEPTVQRPEATPADLMKFMELKRKFLSYQ